MAARPPRPKMGVATDQSVVNKGIYKAFLDRYASETLDPFRNACVEFFDPKAAIDVAHPINSATGGAGYFDEIIAPLADAYQGLQRRNDILIAGEYLGGEWVTSMGYFYGHFTKPWLDIAPSQNLEFIRFGEFHQIQDGKVVQSQVFLGIAELIIALGRWPLAKNDGFEGVFPAPRSLDGLQMSANTVESSRASGE